MRVAFSTDQFQTWPPRSAPRQICTTGDKGVTVLQATPKVSESKPTNGERLWAGGRGQRREGRREKISRSWLGPGVSVNPRIDSGQRPHFAQPIHVRLGAFVRGEPPKPSSLPWQIARRIQTRTQRSQGDAIKRHARSRERGVFGKTPSSSAVGSSALVTES